MRIAASLMTSLYTVNISCVSCSSLSLNCSEEEVSVGEADNTIEVSDKVESTGDISFGKMKESPVRMK